MRICFVHTDFRIYWPPRLNALNEFLTAKGIDFNVVEIAGYGSPYSFEKSNNDHPSFWYCLFPDKPIEEISSLDANKAVIRKLEELKPDVIFSGAIAYPSGAASVKWSVENRKRCLIFDNARLSDVPRRKYVNLFKKMVFSGVNAIFCPAPAWNSTYRFFGFSDQQIFHGLNVVDNSFWQKQDDKFVPGLPERYFLSVGRQVHKKNFAFIVRAYLNYCDSTNVPADLVLVGNGPDRSSLERISKVRRNGKIHFLDFSTQEELRTIYRNSLCLILASRYGETWGLVVNEAMASGLPVLVSNQVGCASTLVRDGENGFVFSPDRPEQLSLLMTLMANFKSAKLSEMGDRSRDLINDWDIDRFNNGVYNAMNYVIENPRSQPKILSRLCIYLWIGRYRPL